KHGASDAESRRTMVCNRPFAGPFAVGTRTSTSVPISNGDAHGLEACLKLLTDNPVHSGHGDKYGFYGQAHSLCEAIAATHDLPLTVGIYGPWGSGKSSFLNISRAILRDRKVPTVSFNPWKYDQRDEVWHALIQTVLEEISAGLEMIAA